MKKNVYRNIIGKKAVVLGIALVFVFSAFIPVVGSNVGSTVSRSSEKSENEEIFNIGAEETVDEVVSDDSMGSESDISKTRDGSLGNRLIQMMFGMINVVSNNPVVNRLRELFTRRDVGDDVDDVDHDENQMGDDQLNSEKQANTLNQPLDQPTDNLGPLPLGAGDPWWNPGWSYRKEITINHSKVDASLTNFPVLISLTSDVNLSDDAKCQNDGDDIAFTDDSGNQLYHEIELFNGSTGELLAWVKVPSLSGSVNTSVYLYYGNPSASSQEDVSNVWDGDFTLVQHLSEKSGTHFDSTSYGNDGTLGGGTYINVSQDAVGIIDGADSFNGTDGHVDCGSDGSLEPGTGDFTFEAWVKRASVSTGNYHAIVSKRHSNSVGYIWWITNSNSLRFFSVAGDLHYGSIADTDWHHVAVTLDRDDVGVVYKDGVSVGSLDISGNTGSVSSTQLFSIGQQTQGASSFNQPFDGTIDEVRVSKTPRNGSWIKTEYNNHQYPGLFHDKGPEEVQPGAPVVSLPLPVESATDVSISLSELKFNLSHKDGTSMDYSVETSPDIGFDSDTGVGNGTKTVSVSGLSYSTVYTWFVNVTDGTHDVNITYTFTTEDIPDPWWNPSWEYRKPISIDHTKVDENLTNFPILIKIPSDTDLSNDLKCQNNGNDIAFADNEGNKLNHEIELFNGATGELIAWVKIPKLNSIEDEILYLYYGNLTVSSQQNPTNVWDTYFTLIQHLNETSGTHYDSTVNDNDGSPQNGVNQSGIGLIDGCDTYDATDDYVDCGYDSGLEPGTGDFTIEVWVKRLAFGTHHSILSKRTGSDAGYAFWIEDEDQFRFFAPSINMQAGSIADSNWYYAVVTLDRDGNAVMYVDGSAVSTLDISSITGSITSSQLFAFGAQYTTAVQQPMNGSLDEVRLSQTVRNISWIKACCNNQNDPSNFHTIEPEELLPDAPIVSNPSPADSVIDISLSLSQLDFDLSHKAASTMDYWIETSPNIGSDSDTGVGNGTYGVSVSGLAYDTVYSWFVNVTDGIYDINMTYSFTTEKAPAPWWNSDWSYRKEISIDYTKVDADLTDFPVLISLTSDVNLSDDAKCQNDGDDIAFADYNGIKLPHEIVTFNGATGELLVWVKVTSLSSTENTKLYLYYGNSGASNQEDVSNVWDSDFTLVQHLDETSGTHYDSTSYDNDGTLGGDTYTNVSQNAVGMIDGADSFNGTDGHVNCGSDGSLEPGTGDFTFEAWVKRASVSTGNYHTIVSKRVANGVGYLWWITNNNALRFFCNPSGSSISLMYGSIADTSWHHVAVTLDRDGNGVVYKDGSSVGSQDISTQTGSISSTQFFSIGQQMNGANGLQPFDGTIDEVRVSKTWRNSSWIKTEYNNQLNPTAFRTIGPEEPIPPIPIVSNELPVHSAVDVSISLSQLKFNLSHADGTSMDYNVDTSPSIGSGSGSGVGNGTKTVSISGLSYSTVYTWFVNVTDGTYDTNMTYTFTTEQAPIPWWDNEWAYRRQINVDYTLVDGDLVGFPVLISFNSDVDLANDSKCQDDGDDIVFTNETGVVLPHELELFNGSSGELVVWVNANVSSSVDTVLLMYYGNPSCDNQEDAGGIWDGNYTMVQHLSETSGIHYDSSSFGNNGTSVNGVNQSGIGIIDGADTFGLDEDYVDCGSDTDLEPGTGDFSIEMWIKRVALSGTIGHFIIAKRSTDGYGMWISKSSSSDQIRFYAVVSGGPIDFQGGSITDFNWHHVAVTLDRDGNAVIYLDGGSVAATDISSLTSSISSANPCTIGNNGASTWDHDGTIDEVRVSNVVRSGDWIGASYNNQNNPGGFYSVLTEEVTSGPVVSDPVPVHDAVRVDVSLSLLSFNLSHKDGTLMDYSVETNPNIGSDTAMGVGNGTYSISISSLAIDTVYTWFVNVSDGSYDVNKTFVFTTEPPNSPPVVSSPIPADEQTDVPLSIDLSVYVSDVDLDSMDVTFMTNASGSWQVIGSNTSVGDGRYSQGYTFPDYNTEYYWCANASDGTLWVNNTYRLTIMVEPGVWDIDCLYRKKIIIDYTMVPSDLNDFPLLIDVTDSDLENKAQNDGDDIRFTNYSGGILSHEIEYYDDSDGHLVAWVNIDSLSSSFDTTLYMYYGNPSCGSQEDASGVWDSNFKMVQHLDETSGTHYDSTVNDNDGTPYNGVNQSGIGIIDGCDTYDATDDYVDCGYDFDLEPNTGDYTIEVWIKRLDFGTHHSILSKRTGTGDGYAFWIEDEDQLRFYAKPVGSSINMQAGSITDSNWHYAVVTLDRDGNAVLYLDGSPVSTLDISTETGAITSSQLFAFGAQYTTGVQQPMNGSLDEIRLSNVARSSDWIGTCYDNQLNPGGFYSLESEEISAIPIIYNPIPADEATNVPTDLSNLTFSLKDHQGDSLDYSVVSIPDIGSDSATGVGNGTYNVSVISTSPNTYHKWFVNVTDGTHWNNNTYTFTTQDFPPSFTATAYNRSVINLTSITGQPGTDSIMIRYNEFDSSQGWPYKKLLNINTPNNGYQMQIRVYKNDGYDDPANGKVDCEGHCNDDFSDIKFLNAAEDTELSYWIENKTDGEYANIWVKTNGESSIIMLYGYTTATSMSNGTATFEFFEDFSRSRSQLEATGLWYKCGGSARTSNGILYWTGGPGGVFHTTHQPFKFNMTFRFRAYLKNEQQPDENGQSVAAFDPLFPESGGTNHHFDMLGSWYGQLPHYQICFGGGSHTPNIPGVGFDCQQFSTQWPYWQTYEITRLHNITYAGNVDYGEQLNSTLVIPRDCNLGVTSCTIRYGMESETDWFLLREYADPAPTWSSFGSEEASCTYPTSQFPSSITDGTLLMNSSATSFDHTGLNFGTAYCYSAWAYNASYNIWSSKIDRVAVTHANQVPMLTNEYPTDGAGGINPGISSVNIEINDPDGDLMNWTIGISNGDHANGSGASDGTISCSLSTSLDHLTTYTWLVNVTDGNDWTNRTYTFTTGPQPAPWWNAGWQYRKYIMIDYTKVVANSALDHFPVLISFDSNSDLASNAQEDGDDIVFTDYSSNQLNHEIELYDNSTGQLVAWVNVTSLSDTEDTILYMYYGNDTCGSQENIAGVWDSHFTMVQHLNETSGTHSDSTSYGNDGTLGGGTYINVSQNAVGMIDGADSFNGTDGHVDCGSDSSLEPGTGDFTFEAWVKRASISNGYNAIVSKRHSNSVGYIWWITDSNSLRFSSIAGDLHYSSIADTNWHHLAVTLDRDGNGVMYKDGVSVGSQDISSNTGSISSTQLFSIGQQTQGASTFNQPFDGNIDETRVSDIARSHGWIATSFNNQDDPSSFCPIVGIEELIPQEPFVFNPSPTQGDMDVPISTAKLSFNLIDYQNDLMNYTVETSPDIGLDTVTNVGNGVYNITVSGLDYNTIYTWYVNVTDGAYTANKTYHFTTEYPLSFWSHRIKIAVNHSMVDENLTDFPIYIQINNNNNLASHAQNDFDDILFTNDSISWTTDSIGERLPHEIETYNSVSGDLTTWVKVDHLSATQDTTLYMYYGNPNCSNMEKQNDVWNNHYMMIHHLNETSGIHHDSTSYGNDGTSYGSTQDASGMVDGGNSFDGSDDYIRISNDPSLQYGEGSFTAEAWIKPISGTSNVRIVNNRGTGGSYKGWQLKIYSADGGGWKFQDSSIDDATGNYKDYEGTTTYDYDEWHHVAMIYDADNELRFYVDGNLDGNLSVGSYGSITNDLPTAIGAAIASSGIEGSHSQFFNGNIDEVRLSNVARSDGWIKTSYMNQYNPAAFCGFRGPEVSLVSPADSTTEYTYPPINFTYIPKCYSGGGCDHAELWFNATEWCNGTLSYSDYCRPQRGVIKNGKLIDTENGITVRYFPNGTILRHSNVIGWTNVAPVVDNGIVYVASMSGKMAAYNWSNDTVLWTTNIENGVDSNSMPLYKDHLYVESRDFIIHKINITNGNEIAKFSLDYSGVNNQKAHPLVDYQHDRLYALGDSKYHCIDLNTFSEIWNVSIVTHGGQDSRGGPILLNNSDSGQYMTIISTYPQKGTYAVGFDGSIIWAWTEKTVRQVITYNPNTGYIYITDSTGYRNCPGTMYAMYPNNGTVAWVTHGEDGDHFCRPVTASGNYLIFKTDNLHSTDYLYVKDATTGETLSKISAGSNRGYWCYPPALSGGYVATGGGYGGDEIGALDIFHVGNGSWVDYYPLHANVNHTGYVENGLTTLGFPTETWECRKINETPLVNNSVNGISFDFTDYDLPRNFTWNIRLVQSDGQEAWGETRTVYVLPVNRSPTVSNPTPADGACDVPLSLAELTVDIEDREGDSFSWSIETSPDIGSNSSGGYDSNGTKTCDVSGLAIDTTYTWYVNTTDLGSGNWTNVTYQFSTPQSLSKWLHRKKITIDHSQVVGDPYNYPVLIQINNDDDLANDAQDDFDDILFTNDSIGWSTDSSTDRLNHEIESFDSGEGNLTVWVNVTSLSNSEDTILYMYYGNSNCGNMEDVAGTWSSDFALVQHLDEDSGAHYDSTVNDNDGTAENGVNQDTEGLVDGADRFDGDNDYINIPSDSSHDLPDELTVSMWIKPSQVYNSSVISEYVVLLNRQQSEGDDSYQLSINMDGRLHLGSSGGNIQSTQNSWQADSWYYVVGTYRDDLSGEFYINGALEPLSVDNYDDMSSVSRNVEIGGIEEDYWEYFNGTIDEVRILDYAVDSSWVSTDYNNQFNPDMFCSVGSEECIEKPKVSDPVPANGAENVPVTLSKLEFNLTDMQGDQMDYSVETSPDVGWDSATGVDNGTYNISVSNLAYCTTYTWYVNVTDGAYTANETYHFTTKEGLSCWSYRKKIVVNYSMIDDDLTNFPMLIEFTDDSDLAAYAQDDFDDILFTSDSISWNDGFASDRLSHEIETYDSSDGNLTVWVNVPYVSSAMDTTLYMYFGNPSCSNMEKQNDVWNNHYMMIHHLNETSGMHHDSTSYGNDGTNYGSTQDASGMVDGGNSFDGSNDYIRISNDPSLQYGEGSFTAEAWIKPESCPTEVRIINNRGAGAGGSYNGWQLKIADSTGKWKLKDTAIDDDSGNYKDYDSTNTYSYNEWYHIVMVYDADNQLRFYVNGVLDGTLSVGSYGNISNGLPTAIGASIAANGAEGTYSQFFDGGIDEVRISDVVRDAAWIKACYVNQNDPDAFYGVFEYPSPVVTLDSPVNNSKEYSPVNFTFTPECYSPGDCTRAELWFNLTETYNGSVHYSASSRPQRGVIKDKKLYVLEGGRITIRDFPNGTILRQGSTFGASHTNTAPYIIGDKVYGMNTAGRMQCYNETTGAAEWTVSVCTALQSNSFEYHDGYFYVESTNFTMHKVDVTDGSVDDMFQLHYTGSNTEKAHPLIDYQNNRLYALGNSKYHCIDLTTFTEIWNKSIVTNGGQQTRSGSILVNDSYSGQYLTIFSTFPQIYTYAFDYDGNIVWTWTTKTIRAHAAYNPNTGLIYLADATGYSDSGAGLSVPGSIYAVYVNNGTTKWVTHGTGGGDKFARPITTSGNYIIWKTDNSGKNDYLYVGDATTGETLAKISAGDDRGYWCYPCALSGGYVATGGGYTHNGATPITDIYHIGDGDWVDSYPLHGNVNHTGYVENGLTSLGFTTETWESRKINDTPIINNSLNGIEFDFSGYDLPLNFTWNIKIIQSDGQSAWGDENWNVRVLPVNQSPDISSPSPVDNSANVPLSLTQLSIYISDPENDLFNWSIETSPNIGSSSGTLEGDGTKTCSISGLQLDTSYTWYVNASDVGSGGWTNVSFSFTTPESLSGWLYRKEIVIDHLLVDTDLYNFPVLIQLDNDADLADRAQVDFDDVLFTNDGVVWATGSSGERLSHEIESYDSGVGDLTVWVNVTYLSSSADTVLYMYYGNSGCGNQEYIEGTWNSDFALVHHFEETSGTHFDSTFNDNDGTCSGGVVQNAVGMIDGADEFDGVDDLVDIPSDSSHNLPTEVTLSMWFKPDVTYDSGLSDYLILLNRQQPETDDSYLFAINPDGRLHLGSNGGNIQSTQSSWSSGSWYHVVGTYHSASGELYINGASETLSVNNYDTMSSVDRNIEIGGVFGYGDFFDGIIDEIRIYNKAVSTGWVSTEYNNQHDPSSFYNVGLEESIAGEPIISSPSPVDGATEVERQPTLSVYIVDAQGDSMDVEFRSNASGSWQTLCSYTGVGNGARTCSNTGSMNSYNHLYWWSVNATDPLGTGDWTNHTFRFTTLSMPGPWFNNSWMYRRKIVINHSLVDDDLFNFTVLIDITDSNVSDNAQADGDDLVFTSYNGVQHNHEIEIYNNTNGHLIAWVKIPFLSSSVDTILYLYYGNPISLNMENASGTWDEFFRMVQHLNETSGIHYDSTVYGNDGTNFGSTQDYVGIIDHGNSLDGTDDYIRVPTDSSIQFDEGSFTAEVWIKPNTGNINTRIINTRGKGAGGTVKGWQLKIAESAGKWKLKDSAIDDDSGNYKDYDSTNTYSYNEWYHIVMVYDADNQLRFYVNGVLDGTLSVGSYRNISNGLPTAIGASIATNGVEGTYDQFYNGGIDEIRLSNATRSSGWITTEYNNQFVPDSFFDIGDVEIVQTGDTIPPVVSDVSVTMSDPVDTDPSYGWENITCTVTDNLGVHSVFVNITYPDLHTESHLMTDGGGGQYYYNTTFSDVGNYSYHIWANDTSNNWNISSVDAFEVPPNWDINMDGVCDITDVSKISIEWLNSGSNGWIREDINNDGKVDIIDVSQISVHWLETW